MKAKIGMFGLGNVGQGVAKIISENREAIRYKSGIDLDLNAICVRDTGKSRGIDTQGYWLTTDKNALLDDPCNNVIVELIGGTTDAKDIVFTAIEKGKHVVTGNKALLAAYGDEIFKAAKEKGVIVNYEAAVAGSIPIIRALDCSLVSDNITALYGLMNGTTNFMLTKMAVDKLSYAQALKQAQDLGFAEADPSFDVGGKDAAQKLLLAASLAFNAALKMDDIYFEGIEKVSKVDMDFAKEMGYSIKLLAYAGKENGSLSLRVYPALIPKSNILAGIDNEINAIVVKGNNVQEQTFIGRGAGGLPTASVVVSDIVDVLRKTEHGFEYNPCSIKPMEDLSLRYYLRFNVEDKPGVLASITSSLAGRGISIDSMVQRGHNNSYVPVVLMTHKALEKDVMASLSEIDKKPFMQDKAYAIRVADL